ncbi:helix-turn-helix transcriptional regulator [Rubrivivax rivuli]|uniref:AraC family transcriptional regulator n=1 Tax=Rubrivivax rivuli TaxID=1862385 RepID=A0A437RAM2_9BURK|nr:AraC family transcriptional regulator [Rubrivivax rivuli]RVU43831.1 AraC family transcriptional regulator [Rubrivivax rivuli]
MSDFASAAMLRVLVQGMRELGLDPGDAPPGDGEARVQLGLKQGLVQRAVLQGGLACLPLLGRGLRRLAHEPTHQALVAAHSASDLLARWQRLERYVHSRHRCVVEHCDDTQACVRHVTVTGQGAPTAAEDFVVAGVLAALLESIGLRRVSLSFGEQGLFPASDPQGLAQAAAAGASALWQFHWQGRPARGSAPVPGPAAWAQGADPAWAEPVRRAYLHLAADLARPWGLPVLAGAMGLSTRSLQRQLAAQGLSYSRLLAEARCRVAAWRLLYTGDPVAEVGFLSGFSDQPHFTRELQKRVGMPPAAYRQAFAARPVPGR